MVLAQVIRFVGIGAVTLGMIGQVSAQRNELRFRSQGNPNEASARPSVSQDLLSIYAKTQSAKNEAQVTSIARACSEIVPDESRSAADRDYASSLLAWALNRRGEMRSDRAADLVAEGSLAEAARLDRLAAADFETAIQYGPENWRTHHNYAISLAMRGDYQAGIKEFSTSIRLNPEYANAYFNRGELYFEIGDYQRAGEDYEQAIGIKGDDPQYYNSLAHCQFMKEEYKSAVKNYRQATELGTDSATYATDLADAYQFLGKWQEAAEGYRTAISINNRYARAYQNAAWLMATCPDDEIRNEELALAAAQRAMELDEPSARSYDTLAAARAANGEMSTAVKMQRQAVALAEQDEKSELQQRLAMYERGQVFRQAKPIAKSLEQVRSENRIRTASGTTFENR